MMQQMYANYMTQYIQYLQSIGAMAHWPASATQNLVEHTNQIAEEARAAGVGAAPPHVFNHVAAAAMAGAMAGGLPHDQTLQPQQPQPDVNPEVNADVGAPADVPVDNNLAPNVVMNAGAGGIGKLILNYYSYLQREKGFPNSVFSSFVWKIFCNFYFPK